MTDVVTTPAAEAEAPAAIPTPESVEETEAPDGSFSDEEVTELLGDEQVEEEGVTLPADPEPTPEQPEEQAEPVPVEGEEPTPEAPVEPEPAEVAATPPETPPEAPTPEPVPAEPQPDFAALRQQAVDDLTKTYAISEEDAETMVENPEKILPGLLARVHTDVYSQVLSQVIGSLPQMVQGLMGQADSINSAERQFYDAFPQLNKPEHRSTVEQVTTMYRQMHPEFDFGGNLEQAIQDIGRHASFMLQLEIPQAAAPAPIPAIPAVPEPQAVPHTPVLPGAAAIPAAPAAPSGEWDETLQEFERLDEGS